ncbi:putative uncharacterized protein precursor [Thermotoga petrophila RKU-10]|uniref:Uncharacterized protein n=1 Tax=Thermotoga petrophila (strain ATCC BAA-489 / DSM 13996 / JCM 10882 / RKU-10) TaxID=590168 RepID=D2C6F0_THEP2|nr:hypothetical protein [Thermotoga petrophila]ADA66536.1 putative uncharacterized protein precursor [Thermotoga petrophila RKU-10]
MGENMRWLAFFFTVLSCVLFPEPLITQLPPQVVYENLESKRALPGVLPVPSGEKKDGISFRVSPFFYSGNFEGKTKTGWFVLSDPPWENFYLYENIPPLFSALLEGNVGDVSFYTEIPFNNNYNYFYKESLNNIPPLWKEIASPDSNFPYTAYGVYNGDSFYAVIGRSKIRWGSSEFPVAISDVSPYFNHFTFSTKGKIQYTFHLVSINPVLTEDEWEKQSTFVPVNADPLSPYTEKVKTLAAHRLDFHIRENLRLGVGELTMIGGKYPDLFAVSPFSIWHNNYNEGYTNSMASFDFSWVPKKGFEVHGEFVLDDLVGTTEDESKPTAYAFNVGARKTFSTGSLRGVFGVEYALATKFVYNTFLPYLKFNNRIVYLTNLPSSRTIVDYPVGFAFGPDAKLLNVSFDLFKENVSLETDFFYLVKGPNTLYTEYPTAEEGETKNIFGASLRGKIGNVSFSLLLSGDEFLAGLGVEFGF